MAVYGTHPDFLVLGAQRSGTTLFYELLCRHTHVVRARRKEVHFFDRDYAEGEAHYRSFFRKVEDVQVTGEATPYYLYHPDVPKRAHALVPDARLIALLRNPIDRAHSHWRFQTEIGHETLPFEEAIEAEDERLAGTAPEDTAHRRFSYLRRGHYAPQLARWLGVFGPEALAVYEAEDFFEKPGLTLRCAHGHLGLEPRATRKAAAKNVRNATKGSRMSPDTRKKLEGHFGPLNRELYDLLDRDLRW